MLTTAPNECSSEKQSDEYKCSLNKAIHNIPSFENSTNEPIASNTNANKITEPCDIQKRK